MGGQVRAARLVDGIEGLAQAVDDRILRARILAKVQGVVPFDAYAFLLTDPLTCVGCSPLAEIPDLSVLPDLIRLKYLTDLNRWTTLPTRECRTLQQESGGRPS